MKKVVEMKIKADKSLAAKKFISKVQDIVDELNNEDIDEFDEDEISNLEDIEEIVKKMYEKDYSLKEVMEITGLTANEIATIIEDID